MKREHSRAAQRALRNGAKSLVRNGAPRSVLDVAEALHYWLADWDRVSDRLTVQQIAAEADRHWRTTREAIRTLHNAGLVEYRPGSGEGHAGTIAYGPLVMAELPSEPADLFWSRQSNGSDEPSQDRSPMRSPMRQQCSSIPDQSREVGSRLSEGSEPRSGFAISEHSITSEKNPPYPPTGERDESDQTRGESTAQVDAFCADIADWVPDYQRSELSRPSKRLRRAVAEKVRAGWSVDALADAVLTHDLGPTPDPYGTFAGAQSVTAVLVTRLDDLPTEPPPPPPPPSPGLGYDGPVTFVGPIDAPESHRTTPTPLAEPTPVATQEAFLDALVAARAALPHR